MRNRSFAIINVLGLAVGIAASLLIFLVVKFETSYDNFHSKRDHIYRVVSVFSTQDGSSYSAGTPFPVGPALRLDFPQIKEVANTFRRGTQQITIEEGGQQKKFQSDVYYIEPEFFRMFDFEWLSGDPKASLSQPANAVLTKEIAEKYFGTWQSAIGKTIKYNNDNAQVYKVSGILKNVPPNTDFPLGIVVSYATLKGTNIGRNMEDWVSTFGAAYTFVVLPSNYSSGQFNKDLATFAKKHRPVEYSKDSYMAQPLTTIHSDERFGGYGDHFFSDSLVTVLKLIGLFLILIACVNFVNLATAQAVNRSKEVGVRKVLGSNRGQLAAQFLSETSIIVVFALVISAIISYLVLPSLNELLNTKMTLDVSSPAMILFLISVLIGVSLLSGIYPAMVISGFNPITALKNKISSRMAGGISLRRVLVILQFAIAHVMIIGTLIAMSQMNFFRNATLGFDQSAIINVNIPQDSISRAKMGYLQNELSKNQDIKNVSFSYRSPSADGNWNSDFKFDHATNSTNFSANLKWADVKYFETYKIQFVAGRPYHESDTVREFVVNETLLRKLGITDPTQAINKQIDFWDGNKVGPIVGVIRDFNSFSLRDPMAPVVLSTWKDVYQTINIRIKEGKEKAVLPFVEKLWNKTYPDYVYQYSFLDETIANFYQQEARLSTLYKIFAAIAIFISCLGLYGLVSFMASQRTKEVGIRKVLGASAGNIVFLLSKEFSILIIIAFAIAVPVAYYVMNNWLQNYTYRIEIGIALFVFALLGSMAIAWITVGHRAIKAAIANPVKSLRTE
jgi:ABC-type antimicrobial peptide transport system permease subunit